MSVSGFTDIRALVLDLLILDLIVSDISSLLLRVAHGTLPNRCEDNLVPTFSNEFKSVGFQGTVISRCEPPGCQ